MSQTQAQLMARREDFRTAHLLHLVLSVLTGGLWLVIWAIVAISHAIERGKIDNKLGKLEQ